MIFQTPPRLAALLLSLFLPEREKEALLGDLAEEYNLSIPNLGGRSARRWYWRQVARSAAPLLWANFRRGNWLKTLGAVLAGYFVVIILVVASEYALSKLVSNSPPLYAVISLVSGFPVMLVGGYFVARLRTRAVSSFAIFVTLMGLLSLMITGGAAPVWYQISLIIIAPVASLTGGRLFVRGARERSKTSGGNVNQGNSAKPST